MVASNWAKTTIGVQYDTPPEKIEAFCEGIRELVRGHPYMRQDYYNVYMNGFGPSSRGKGAEGCPG